MSITYDSRREPLAEIIQKATVNATYLIPDLQRPFVWTPRQVILLVDSLFKGWPFGSLLLWEVRPDCFGKDEGIPHRPFWEEVDRTDSKTSAMASPLGQPATYQMVLDGQQRIQSLLLALGGDTWGFKLKDADWSADLQERRVKPSKHWSKASLCVDLKKFKDEFLRAGKKARKIETGEILDWIVRDASDRSAGSRPSNYEFPVKLASDHPGRFIRLWRFWDLVQKDLSESEYEELLECMLRDHKVVDTDRTELLRPLAQFMKVVEGVKLNSVVHALQIGSFTETAHWTRDDYSDAIVTIFTRLNTAGRTLTREEITLAWLKVGWMPSLTDDKPAGECLDDLRASLTESRFGVETDDIVRLISFAWAVEHQQGKLLDSKDLLKGAVVRPMADSVAHAWKEMEARFTLGAKLIEERDLVGNVGSFNAVIVFLNWHRLIFDRVDGLAGLKVLEKDALDKQLEQRAAAFLDRWIFSSQWANVWADDAVRNFQNFANDLSDIRLELGGCTATNIVAIVDSSIGKLMDRVAGKAKTHVGEFVVDKRSRVHDYFSLLWTWHRLDAERWKYSSIQMREGEKRVTRLDVDHAVADAYWQQLVKRLTQEKRSSFVGTEEDRALLAPGTFTTEDSAKSFINQIGNCSLLDKSFNISKSDKTMWSFLSEVHEFKEGKVQRAPWQRALSLTDKMTEPDSATFEDLMAAIETRSALIRSELTEFVDGKRQRVDIDK